MMQRWIYFILMTATCRCNIKCSVDSFRVFMTSSSSSSMSTTQYYKYFAIGSNMVPTTMTSLRNLKPITSPTAAILPNYQLVFNIPGNPFIEPSAASVIPTTTSPMNPSSNETISSNYCVHGVLYTLTEDDFAQLGRSEGVPYVYRWERCYPIPYVGNNNDAGSMVLKQYQESILSRQLENELIVSTANVTIDATTTNENNSTVDQPVEEWVVEEAFVLVASNIGSMLCPITEKKDIATTTTTTIPTKNIPPSKSYLEILQDGAAYWKMDMKYQNYLRNDIKTDPFIPGVSKQLLQIAERINPT